MKKDILDFIKTVGRLIEIGHDYPNFMDELYSKGFRLEFMGVETRLPLGAEEWDLINTSLRDIADLD
jgi:hypothetical protein